MKEININTRVTKLDYSEIPEDLRELVGSAQRIATQAYAPYSHFRVGAAILLDDGTIVTGNNQENVAYPSGTCAERTACYYAHAQHPGKKFQAVAIAAIGTDGQPVKAPISPCGACRQALLEYETLAGAGMRVILCAESYVYMIESIRALLPLAFTDF